MVKFIANKFEITGKFLAYEPFGNGHINETYMLLFKQNNQIRRYVLQKMNSNVFTDIEGLMNNIVNVTDYLREKYIALGEDPSRKTITIIKTKDGKNYYADSNGNKWRVMLLIENTMAYEIAVDNEIFGKTGKAFGEFICLLDGYPAESLVDIIPNFHNTAKRYENFEKAVKKNTAKRKRYCRDEINEARANSAMASIIVDMLDNKKIPLRVTHNDTKINNILMDAVTGEPVCVIDLDTIMSGSLLYDFGDAIRSGCNTSFEDDKNLGNVDFDIEKFEYFTQGFLQGIGNKITEQEKKLLAISAVIITYECGIRFLTDYLEGDVYFKTRYGNHNLIRCRTQFKLVGRMIEMLDEMNAIVEKYSNIFC